jgi:hypothetical protein
MMYLMQEAGEELKLSYQEASYGPYAENLRHVLNAIEGHYISGYGDAEDRPDIQIEVMPEAWVRGEEFLENHPETRERFDRVVRLIEGFETPFGMELLTTVHWVATRKGASNAEEAIARTYEWGPRKAMFTQDHIRAAFDVLSQHGWLGGPGAAPVNGAH